MSDCANPDQGLPQIEPSSQSQIRQGLGPSFFNYWVPIRSDSGNIIDWGCPVCRLPIGMQNSGRGICPKCGLSIREKPVIIRELPRSEQIRNWKDFVQQEKIDADAESGIQRGTAADQQQADPERRADQASSRPRREAHASTRY